MRRRAYPITVLSGTLAVLVAQGVGAQVTPDPVLRPGAVQTDPALRPDQTNPAPVLRPGAVQTDPALTPFQTSPAPVSRPGAVQTDPALRPDQTNPVPVVAPTPSDSLAPLAPIFPNRN
ncbi:MAG TPA: hypothetical protein VFN70_10095 [Burkholderiales bacterium]|nr:hypothetical protein [Burkholderiales bacterium]